VVTYLAVGLDAALGVVFAVSTWSKLMARGAFTASLRPLRLVPRHMERSVATAMTAVELTVALGLCWAVAATVGPAPAGRAVGLAALTLAAVLLVILTAGIALELRGGTQATCACFGASQRPLGRRHLVRNGLLIAGALAGAVAHASAAGSAGIAGAAVGLAAGAVVALVLIRLEDLIDLFSPIPRSLPRS
jgi:Methylamine utilisation protein MauE